MGSGLFIQMFGPMGFTVSGRPVTTKLSAKSLAILGFLLCSEQHRASREKLASMLWSESYDTATYNLRYNLWNIKKVIPADENGQEFLLASKDACYINPDYQYASDLKRLETLLAVPRDQASREQLSEMKFILERELMEEFYIRDSSDFNDWLLFERTRYQKLSQQVLERLLDSYAAVQDRDGVRQTLEDLLRISPYEEEYYCRMMRLCLEQGDRPAAIQYYQKCEDLLRKDLNLPPSKRLRELYLDLAAPDGSDSAGRLRPQNLSLSLPVWPGAREVPGCVLAEVIAAVSGACERSAISQLPRVFLEDLSSIQPLLIPAWGLSGECRQVSQVRLLNSLCGFFSQLAHFYHISIQIEHFAWADAFSRTALEYLQHACTGTLALFWEEEEP